MRIQSAVARVHKHKARLCMKQYIIASLLRRATLSRASEDGRSGIHLSPVNLFRNPQFLYSLSVVKNWDLRFESPSIIKKRRSVFISGGSGIRTHGTLRHSGFQDRCIRPLCHPSNGHKKCIIIEDKGQYIFTSYLHQPHYTIYHPKKKRGQ